MIVKRLVSALWKLATRPVTQGSTRVHGHARASVERSEAVRLITRTGSVESASSGVFIFHDYLAATTAEEHELLGGGRGKTFSSTRSVVPTQGLTPLTTFKIELETSATSQLPVFLDLTSSILVLLLKQVLATVALVSAIPSVPQTSVSEQVKTP